MAPMDAREYLAASLSTLDIETIATQRVLMIPPLGAQLNRNIVQRACRDRTLKRIQSWLGKAPALRERVNEVKGS